MKRRKPHSEETKRKIGDAHRGRVHTETSRKNMSEAHKGYRLSEETKAKLRQISLGNSYAKGNKLSAETRAKMSRARIGRRMSLESRKKMSVANSGEKNHFWMGGVSKMHERIRKSLQMRLWRETVFTRDNWTCVFCQQRGGRLHPDHIKSFAQILRENKISSVEEAVYCDELWDVNNGRTLCVPCHKKTDTYGWRALAALQKHLEHANKKT